MAESLLDALDWSSILDAPKPLNPTHKWGMAPTYVRDDPDWPQRVTRVMVPFCRACWTWGYEDEHAAFRDCRPLAGEQRG